MNRSSSTLNKPWFPSLARQFPHRLFSTTPDILEANSGDAWTARAQPEVVFYPENAKQVAQLLRWASQHRVPITPRGAGRGYVGGCVPQQGGIVVNFEKMNRILEIHPEDGIAIVQPAVITGVLQKEVAKQGLFYPPDPASLDECWIGGNVATNAGGARCVKYGVTRHYILGLQVALMNGDLVRLGSRTHKNKQGFDLVGLFVGSEGLLGLVTEIIVRLLPMPPARRVLLAGFPTMRKCAATVQKILRAGFIPSALEIADHLTLKAARHHLGVEAVPPGKSCLFVEIDGQPQSVAQESNQLAELIRQQGGQDLHIATTQKEQKQIWQLRREFSFSLRATGLTKLNEDVTVPRSRLVDLIDFAEKLQKKGGFQVACFGHAGDGNIHVNLMVDFDQPSMASLTRKALNELFSQVLAWGGVITGEHGIGLAKKPWWKQAAPTPVRNLHATIKEALDPHHLLNPGKFIDPTHSS